MTGKSSTKTNKEKKSINEKKVSSKVRNKKTTTTKLDKKLTKNVSSNKKQSKTKLKDTDNTLKAKRFEVKKLINKNSITYLGLIIFDLLLTIYIARQNVINYAVIVNKKIMMGKLRYLLLGRNYVNLILMLFFYCYTCLVNKFFLKRKNSIVFLISLLIIIVCFNLLLFYLFSNKVY